MTDQDPPKRYTLADVKNEFERRLDTSVPSSVILSASKGEPRYGRTWEPESIERMYVRIREALGLS